MKKITKNVLAFILAVVMVFGSVPFEGLSGINLSTLLGLGSISVQAETDANTKTTSNAAIDEMKSRIQVINYKFGPNGNKKYFSVNGKKCKHFYLDENGKKITTRTCSNCKLGNIPEAKAAVKGYGETKTWTCFAFAKYVFWELHKVKHGDARNEKIIVKEDNFNTTILKARPGDFIICVKEDGEKAHAGIFTKYDDAEKCFYMYESNNGETNIVSYNKTKFGFGDKILKDYKFDHFELYRAYNYDEAKSSISITSIKSDNVKTTSAQLSCKVLNPDKLKVIGIGYEVSTTISFSPASCVALFSQPINSAFSGLWTIDVDSSKNPLITGRRMVPGRLYFYRIFLEMETDRYIYSSTASFRTTKSPPKKTIWKSVKKAFTNLPFLTTVADTYFEGTKIQQLTLSNASIQNNSEALIVDCPDISIGSSVLLTWAEADFADYYTVSVNGVERPEQITDTQQVLLLDTAGVKNLQVRAHNDAGAGEWSDPAVVTVHDNVTITFTVDGNTYQQTSNSWGTSFFDYPAYPEKEGSTFTGWFKQGTTNVANFEELKTDLTVYAGFRLNTYAVTFLDSSGNDIKTQTVNYGEAATPPDPSEFMPAGYVFLGWNKDFSRITGDLTAKAVVRWENENLPITLSAVSCTRGPDGYTTTCSVANNMNSITSGRIIVALKTQEGKLITTTESSAFSMKANSSKTFEIFTPDVDEDTKDNIGASVAEVYAVKKFQTTVPISLAKTVENITDENPWSDWSEDVPPAGPEIETRTLYRSRDKHLFTTNNILPVDGINFLYNTRPPVTSYGSWSEWSDSAVAPNSNREVKTETRYKFYHYCTGNTGNVNTRYWTHYDPACMPTTTYSYHETGWMTSIPSSWQYEGVFEVEDINHLHPSYIQYDGSGNKIRCSNTCYRFHLATKTVYSYRAVYQTYTYDYYRWNAWSGWSDTAVTPTSSRQVETKTLYRYKMFELEERTEDTSGVQMPISSATDPNLEKFPQYAGKQATLFIYKINEASDWTTEFIGQTVIDEDGAYSFNFKLREEPSEITGDYTVTLGIEGATSAVYLKTIYAPVPEYQVTFADYDGTILSTQTIQKGQNAVVPDSPQREGYTFTGWDACSVNIQSDITVTAQYKINSYTIVFIDWLNHTYSVQTVEHGALLTPPIIDSVAGQNILGWDKVMEGVSTVTSNMVVCASFETQTFTVDFYDFDGNLVDSQVVEYGSYAEAPVLEEGEDFVFLNWQSPDILEPELDVESEPVMKSLSVKPNYVFTETVEVPTACVGTGEYDMAQTIELLCETEGAVIYYTLDGSDPADPLNPAATEYTLPILVTESAELRFYAFALGKNDSEENAEFYAINRPGNVACHILHISVWNEWDLITQIVEDGSKVDVSVIPSLDGYSFEGIYRDVELNNRWDLDTDTVTESVMLYVNYTPNNYNVIFRDSDATILDVQAVEYLSAAQAPEIVAPDGYVFTDWDTEDYSCVVGDLTVTATYLPESEYAKISLNCGNYSMTAGNSFTLSAAITPVELAGKDILWYSSDDTVATVDENGVVTALSAGTATITVVLTENGEFATCDVTVNANAAYQLCLITGSVLAVDTGTGYLRGIKVTANTVAQVKAQFANTGLVFTSLAGTLLADTDLAGTGTVITLVNGGLVLDEITIVVTGDMNGDGLINNRDASMVTRYLVGKESSVDCQITAVDVNADGFVNNRDAAMISRYLVGKEVI